MPREVASITVQKPIVRPSADGRATLEQVIEAFHAARAQVAGLFAMAGIDPTKTRDSARELGINRGLTWRLTRMVRESNPAVVASDVPGTQSMARFFEACRQRGAPQEAIESATAALERFESALAACSGDRKTLSMLMANRAEGGTRSDAEKARRKLFEGACSVWGVQAQTRFVSVFVFPSPDDPTMLDAGHVTGFVGFRRLSTRPAPLYYEAVHRATGEVTKFIKEPLDTAGVGEGQLQLLKAFCQPMTPDIQVVEAGGYKRFDLAPGPLGNEGLSNIVFGTRLRRLYPRYSSTPDTAGFMVLLTTPVERVMFDLFVHHSLEFTGLAKTHLLDRLRFPHINDESEFDRQSLPVGEEPAMLPGGAAGTLCPYIPWYTSLAQDVTRRIGLPIDEFIGSRFEMSYPPISTTLSRRFDLMPPPRG